MQKKFDAVEGSTRKGYGTMYKEFDLLEATRCMDIVAIDTCLSLKPECIHDVDRWGNNAMHICVAGATTIRAPELIPLFLRSTDIDLLHKNKFEQDPLDVAMAFNDQAACELIEPYWNEQFNKRHPLGETEEDASQVFYGDDTPDVSALSPK